MATKSAGHSGKSGKSATASKPPVVTIPLTTKDSKFVYGQPTVSGNTSSPQNQVAIVAAVSIPLSEGVLGKDDEVTLKSNLTSVISARLAPPTLSNQSIEYVHHGFEGAVDVLVAYDASAKTIKAGISSHKIANVLQFNTVVSRGLNGQTATADSTLALVLPASKGNFTANVSVTNQMGSAPKGSAGISWKF